MDKKLKKFELLYQEILQQKRANIFTKLFTNQRYLQDDFRQVWNGSGLKKLLFALNNAIGIGSRSKLVIKGLPQLDVNKMLDLKSQMYEDLPAGTIENGNIGLRLTYDILPEYKYTLLKILMSRDENQNSDHSNFGIFFDYFNELISTAQQKQSFNSRKISTDMKLEIIATPTAGKQQTDLTTNKKHKHLVESGFTCSIYLWFDAQNFKNELKENLKTALNSKQKSNNSSINQTDKSDDLNIDNIAKQEKDIQTININNSKIKLGTETITIMPGDSGTLKKLWTDLKNYDVSNDLAKLAGNALGINKIFGIGGKDQNGEKPDKVRVKQHFWHSIFNIADIDNPYVYVTSKPTLQPWLYKDNYNKSITDIDKTGTTNYAIQLRKSFDESRLKVNKSDPGVLTGDLNNTKIWTIGQTLGKSIWPSQADPQAITQYLVFDPDDNAETLTKKITCRWQYFLDNTHALYAQYRVAIELTHLYNILNSLQDNLNNFNDYILDLQNKNITVNEIQYVINIIGNTAAPHPEYILQNISGLTNTEQAIYSRIRSILVKLINSDIITFLKTNGDALGSMSRLKNNTRITNYEYLHQLLNKNIIKVKKYKDRSIEYNSLNINSIFSNWWKNFYIPATENRPSDNFSLDSQKNLYTNNNKALNNIPTNSKHGYSAFKDVDTSAAAYFNDVILNKTDPFILNNTSLNEFYKNQIETIIYPHKGKDINLLKAYISVFQKFNNLFNNIPNSNNSIYANRKHDIYAEAKQYIILKH